MNSNPIFKFFNGDNGKDNDGDNDNNDKYNEPEYYVYTDGSCHNNGKPNAKAGYGIYFGENDKRNVSKKIEGKQTNNIAELTGIIEAYKIIENDINDGVNIGIVTDSIYSLRCLTTYGKKCNDKSWKDDIPNKELVKYAYGLFLNKPNVKFIHIKAHTNKDDLHSIGNEMADELANKAIGLAKKKTNTNTKIYLDVPYEKKDFVKALGGKWDTTKKKWYIVNDNKNKKELMTLFR